MHASNVAFLLLAASAAVPALAAPLSARTSAGSPSAADIVARDATSNSADLEFLRTLFASRSEDGGAPLAMRDLGADELLVGGDDPIRRAVTLINHSIAQFGRDDQHEVLNSRSLFSHLFSILQSFLPIAIRDITPDELAARGGIDDLIPLLRTLATRDLGADELLVGGDDPIRRAVTLINHSIAQFGRGDQHEVLNSRSLFSHLFSILQSFLPIAIRDITPDELAARGGIDDLIPLLRTLTTRDLGADELLVGGGELIKRAVMLINNSIAQFGRDQHEVRSFFSNLFNVFKSIVPIAIRDITPDELAARSDVDDFIKLLSSRDASFSELQARFGFGDLAKILQGLLGSGSVLRREDVPPPSVARDDMSDLLRVLTQTRDVTPEQLAGLATLFGRSFDDLD